jgi:hypothetical protein
MLLFCNAVFVQTVWMKAYKGIRSLLPSVHIFHPNGFQLHLLRHILHININVHAVQSTETRINVNGT